MNQCTKQPYKQFASANYASDTRTERELCQLAGLPKRCLSKLHSQERYNGNL